jgi:hypothetical protein
MIGDEVAPGVASKRTAAKGGRFVTPIELASWGHIETRNGGNPLCIRPRRRIVTL